MKNIKNKQGYPQNYLKIRSAKKEDAELILDFIRQLAVYEKRLHEVIASKNDIIDAIFNRKIAEAIIAEYKGRPAGFAIFFYNFSTFLGKPGIYIEDLFVNPEHRGKGIGKLLFASIAKLAVERKCCRIEWTVLHWNEPSIKFYENIGAQLKDEWVIYKMSGDALTDIAGIASKYFD